MLWGLAESGAEWRQGEPLENSPWSLGRKDVSWIRAGAMEMKGKAWVGGKFKNPMTRRWYKKGECCRWLPPVWLNWDLKGN